MRITAEDKERARALLGQGLPFREVAERVGINRTTLMYHLDDAYRERRRKKQTAAKQQTETPAKKSKRKLTEDEIALANKLSVEGLTNLVISRRLAVPVATVRNAVDAAYRESIERDRKRREAENQRAYALWQRQTELEALIESIPVAKTLVSAIYLDLVALSPEPKQCNSLFCFNPPFPFASGNLRKRRSEDAGGD